MKYYFNGQKIVWIKPKQKRTEVSAKTLLKIVGAILMAVFVFGLIAFSFLSQAVQAEYDDYFSDPKKILAYKTDTLTLIDRNGEILYRTPGRHNTELISLKDMSPYLVQSTLVTEDGDFYQHDAFSIKAIARALYADAKQQDIYHQGASTITQQLSRTVFLNNNKSLLRKIKEVILAIELERQYSKDQILELYLNSVYYGAGAYGAPEAARVYFNKDVKDLNLAESSLLAGLPVAPSTLSPIDGNREKAENRQKYILETLKQKSKYSEKDINTAEAAKININNEIPAYSDAPHFAMMVKKQLQAEFPNMDIERSGLRVYTTLDKKYQNDAEQILKDRLAKLKNRNVTNGAFYATNPQTGEILAMVGSVDYNQPQWGSVNVLTSPRSPGSSIKPLVYASALENSAIKTTTMLKDEKTTYKTDTEVYTPVDSDGKTRGEVSPRIALSNSLNIPAVEVISKNGLPKTLSTVQRLGISGLGNSTNYGLSFALGGLELKGVDLASSYGVFASGGYLIEPWGVRKVEDRFGKEIWHNEVHKKQVLDPKIAYIITNILSDEKAREMLFGPNNPLEIGRPVAAKTGTGQDFKNAWTVGFTPSLLALTWVGNNDGSPMRDIWGLESAALIWNKFMKDSLSGSTVEQFTQPDGLEKDKVCALDGSRAVEGQPTLEEIMVIGDQPTQYGQCGFLKSKKEEEDRAHQAEEEAKLEAEQQQLLDEQKKLQAEPQSPGNEQANNPNNPPAGDKTN